MSDLNLPDGELAAIKKRKLECCLCPAHPSNGDTVHRVNPTGEIGIWACENCYPEAERLWVAGRIAADGSILGPLLGVSVT